MTSSIEWTDVTWNPVTGCTKVSAGCKHCYAERMAHRLQAMGNPRYTNGFRITLHPDKLGDPLHWRKPRRVFVNSMSDLFHEAVPFRFIAAVFGVMAHCRQHTFQVLTKRAERMVEFFEWIDRLVGENARRSVACGIEAANFGADVDYLGLDDVWPLPNVWLGVSTENQATFDDRVPLILQCPAEVRFISAEPLLGEIFGMSMIGHRVVCPRKWAGPDCPTCNDEMFTRGIDWVIAGGESGPMARPMDLNWARDIRDQCIDAGVPFFFKQIGGANKKASGRQLDGRTWDEMPEVLRGT